ncbi:hypothetical protein LCGC14_1784590, partial [marine sediment metagenome]
SKEDYRNECSNKDVVEMGNLRHMVVLAHHRPTRLVKGGGRLLWDREVRSFSMLNYQ